MLLKISISFLIKFQFVKVLCPGCLIKYPPDGTFQITGSKTWISYGDHQLSNQITHMVLARPPDSPLGTRGLSLFLVPKVITDSGDSRLNGIQVISLENQYLHSL